MIIENIKAALVLMAEGMAGIFVFMFLFYLIILGLNKFFPVDTTSSNK